MALRTIRVQGDSVLTKKSRTVDKMTPRIGELITDMLDTMYDAMGVGLAAPQVGILKRIVVIDVGEGPIVLINPEILETSGEQTGDEGCLSVPGMAGQVTRPNYVKVKALDVNMEEQILEGEGLLARAFCHEIDHLDGKMYTELVEGKLHKVTYDEEDSRRDNMKIVYMGTPDFAVAPLAALVENGYEVEAVITQPDKPKGRGKTMMPTPVKEEALKHEIPVLQPVKVRDPEFVEKLKCLAPDIIVVAAFGQIIPKSILDMPKFGCINIHASLLPKYRGAAPIQQAVIDGEKESGVTIMQMGTGLDTGDMISRIVVPLAKDETGGSLFAKLAQAGAELLIQTLPSIFDGTATREKQPEESPTPYAAMISKKMGLLDFSKNAEELERLIRGLNPWPSAFTFINGKTMKVWKSSVQEKQAEEAPGTVISADKEGIRVACGKNVLVLQEVQLEGKKRMEADAFLRGYQLKPGDMFKDSRE